MAEHKQVISNRAGSGSFSFSRNSGQEASNEPLNYTPSDVPLRYAKL